MAPRFHFAAAIFGQAYVQRFLEAGLPSQLSPGNLPALAGGPRPRYHLFTPAEEAGAIRAAPLYPRLAALAEVVFHDIGAQAAACRARACSPYDVMNHAYSETLRLALADAGALVAIWPDVLFSDGAFARLRDLAARGIRGVATCGNQAHPDLVPAARARFLDPASGALVLAPRQLVGLTLAHLTPYWTQFFADHPCFPSEAATHVQWRVGAEGILMRSSFFHPLLAVPTEASCAFALGGLGDGLDTTDFLATLTPDVERGIHLVADSDEFCTVGIDPRASCFRSQARPLSRAEMALALARTAHPHTRWLFSRSLRFHTGDCGPLWAAREAEAGALVESVLDLVDLLRARPELREDLLALQARSQPSPDNETLYALVARRIGTLAVAWRRDGLRVAVHGAGPWTRRLLAEPALDRCRILGVVDSNPALQGTALLRWTVQAPAGLPAMAPDVVLVAARRAQADILAQLAELPGLRAELVPLFEPA